MMKRITNRILRARRPLVSVLVFCLILIPVFLQAKELAEHEVRAAVETWVRYVTADARPDAVIEQMEPHKVDGETVAYIAHLMGGGFCLCGGDDLVLPVYFYSPQGTYDPQNPNYEYILWEIETRLKYLSEGLEKGDSKVLQYQMALAERASFWQDLIAGRVPPRRGEKDEPLIMELNLTTRWDQWLPYNNFCPVGQWDLPCLVGCVATATSQIMKYWNWPPSGTGSHSYDWGGDDSCDDEEPVGGGTVSATFSDPYDWQNMPDECDDEESPPVQQDAVAELCHEVGVALEMDYGVCGSGAYLEDVDDALEDYFRYDHDATYGERNTVKMTKEIQWLRPLQMVGFKEKGEVGHSWVAFGYNMGTDPWQFKMNMGWAEDEFGWYSCDDVAGFVNSQHHVTRIAPKDAVKFVGASDPGDGSPNDPYENVEEALSEAPDYATLIFKAGSDNTFSADMLTIDRPLTLKGKDVTIRKE